MSGIIESLHYFRFQKIVVAHEIGHALGFKHEQARPDRDRYVTIVEENIEENKAHNFWKDKTLDSHGISYDYGSAMHYGQKVISRLAVNSSPPSVVYMRQWIRSALVQKNACRTFGAKPNNFTITFVAELHLKLKTLWRFTKPSSTQREILIFTQ